MPGSAKKRSKDSVGEAYSIIVNGDVDNAIRMLERTHGVEHVERMFDEDPDDPDLARVLHAVINDAETVLKLRASWIVESIEPQPRGKLIR